MNIFLSINLNICFGCSKRNVSLLLSAHNICIGLEIRKTILKHALLSKGKINMSNKLLVHAGHLRTRNLGNHFSKLVNNKCTLNQY